MACLAMGNGHLVIFLLRAERSVAIEPHPGHREGSRQRGGEPLGRFRAEVRGAFLIRVQIGQVLLVHRPVRRGGTRIAR